MVIFQKIPIKINKTTGIIGLEKKSIMPQKTISLRNFTSIIEDFQNRFQVIAERMIQEGKISLSDKEKLYQDIRSKEQNIAALCKKRACQPADLSDRAYRAYLWLSFLSIAEHFESHLSFITRFLDEWRSRTKRSISVRMYNSSFVFQCKVQRYALVVTMGEGFVTVDAHTVHILVDCALHSNKENMSQLRKISRSSQYKDVMTSIWQQSAHSAQSSHSTQGTIYDLHQLFEKINAEYFQGKLEQPHLRWSSRRAVRRLGYYHPDTDAITLSRFLDQKSIPPYVVEYVMYHEMLHKKLGLKEGNSYRMAHTSQFKRLEKKFKYYTEAEEFLKTKLKT